MKVRDIMSEAIPTCAPRDPLLDAARVMLRHNVSCLPVVTADESRRVVGMLTDRDVSMAVARNHGALGELEVRSAMGPGEPSCSPEAPVADALERMHSAGVSRLPVVDDRGRLVGLLSLEAVARAVSGGRGDVPYELICWTIAESAHPRSSAERRETGEGGPARSRSEPQHTLPTRGRVRG
jgi:CBS domain-containing protein